MLHGWDEVTRCLAFPLSLADQTHWVFYSNEKGIYRSIYSTRTQEERSDLVIEHSIKAEQVLEVINFRSTSLEIKDLPTSLALVALL